uniref:Uncharacterized protein n=1 Tax=Anguilla anguilla TaxID=7936 RepID=A0A0E9VCI6_ANGAN
MKSSRTSTCPRTLSSATGDEPHNSSRPSVLCSEPSEHLKTELKPARGHGSDLLLNCLIAVSKSLMLM